MTGGDEEVKDQPGEEPLALEDIVRDAYHEHAADGPEEAPGMDPGPGRSGRLRDEQGRFAAAPQENERGERVPAERPPEQAPQDAPREQAAPAGAERPPPGWSVAAKAAWEQLPPEVRSAVAHREQEINNGFAELTHWKAVRPYAEMAVQSGTTLPEALERYVGIENMLRQDPVQGLLQIANNLGMSAANLAEIFSAYAGTAAPVVPDQGHQSPADPVLGAVAPVMQQIVQRQQAIEAALARQQEMEQQARLQTAEDAIAQFANDRSNRWFEDVGGEMVRLLQSGLVARTGDFQRDLKAAYDMACRMHPEVHEQLVNERLAARSGEKQRAVERARQASRSISGTATEAPLRSGSNSSLEDIVRDAYRAHMS